MIYKIDKERVKNSKEIHTLLTYRNLEITQKNYHKIREELGYPNCAVLAYNTFLDLYEKKTPPK